MTDGDLVLVAATGLAGVLGAFASWLFNFLAGERRSALRLREYVAIRQAKLTLDTKQKNALDFEIAWWTSRSLGLPASYDEDFTPTERFWVVAYATTVVVKSNETFQPI